MPADDRQACYDALLARDPRFDGRIYVAVRTTGIYCRPICRVRAPLLANCTFHGSAASAERAGYRPCLRCRPELAPGCSPADAVPRLAALAARRIEDGALSTMSVDALAAEFGVGGRHLRRSLKAELGTTPVALAQTQRLLLAKRLLAETAMGMTQVAHASGFSSLRRFNALFQGRYRLKPSSLRRLKSIDEDVYTFSIAYRPPLAWGDLLRFLDGRALPGVERVVGGVYRRTARVGAHVGWISLRPGPQPNTLAATLSASLGPAASAVIARLKALVDARAEPRRIADHLASDPLMAPLVAARPGLRVPGAFDGFEATTRAILGQQVSVAGARTLAGRFVARFGDPVGTPAEGLTHHAPSADRLASATLDEVAAVGIPGRRAGTIIAVARAVAEGRLALEAGSDPSRAYDTLVAIDGIGPWTAEYVAMRALAWPDAFPAGDLGIAKALGVAKPAQSRIRAEGWRPWRSYAVMHLWHANVPVIETREDADATAR